MKIALITDAWQPQVNGVVTTLVELVRELTQGGHQVKVIQPGQFRTRPCPGYAGIELAVRPGRGLSGMLEAFAPDAIHIATEGPLGWAARSHCRQRGLAFTTAFHTKFPEILNAALKISLSWSYALFRHFHKASSGVMVPTHGVLQMLEQRGFCNLRSWTHGVDTRLFAFEPQPSVYPPAGPLVRPVSLFVGRVSYEKNIEAFLRLDIPGTKIVCGVGPLQVLGRVDGSCYGGVMNDDLQRACYSALALPRGEARARALDFSWAQAAQVFEHHLVAAQGTTACKFTDAGATSVKNPVTPLSSNQ